MALLGIAAVTFVLVALVSALVVSLRAAWARIAVRVVGSWIAAIGLLMLGWGLRGAQLGVAVRAPSPRRTPRPHGSSRKGLSARLADRSES
jgi:hypothetical protein